MYYVPIVLAVCCIGSVRTFTPFVVPTKTTTTSVTFGRHGVVVEVEIGVPIINTRHSSSTVLYAEESSQETAKQEQQEQQQSEPKKKDMDILNSPAFLKRKLQVLKNDISKVDDKITKAKADVEAGKAQWGDKLKDLEREVR
jgi:hypothetical protein